ncbi:MAG: cysteine desulfurase [Desulfurococcales archaeon]|nr:cysteine desulfurase [Desulfurococcales archaeon]
MPSCEEIRKDFPELETGIAYLDSAASSLKPRAVVEAMREFTYRTYANVHRGVYKLSLEASRAYEDAHEVVAKFIGARSWEEVIFTTNTTYAMNMAAMALLLNGRITRGSNIVITEGDHHSNILPWITAAKLAGAEVRVIPVNEEGVPRWEMLEELIDERTAVVAAGHVSNVTGYRAPVERIARIAHSVDALVVVDGAQSVPHMPVNVYDLGIDMLAFSGHKMMGPTGIGVLWGRKDLLEELDPPFTGGGTVKLVEPPPEGPGLPRINWEDLPWKFEAGTPPIIEAVGLSAAVEYLERIGMEWIERHEYELTDYTMRLLGELEEVRIVGPRDPSRRIGIVSFVYSDIPPDTVGAYLSSRGVAVRTGLHCAHMLHLRLGLRMGSVRASFYAYNCKDDVERLYEALVELKQ